MKINANDNQRYYYDFYEGQCYVPPAQAAISIQWEMFATYINTATIESEKLILFVHSVKLYLEY